MTGAVADRLDGSLEDRLGHRFRDPGLLEAALTHPSAGPATAPIRYERLEFLGDRVLGLVMAELLLERYPGEDEGALSRRLVALVQRDMLVAVAKRLDLEPHLSMARSSGAEQRRGRDTALADGMEALIAALYLDGGLEVARAMIDRYWSEPMAASARPPRDPKTALQELVQGRGEALPEYVTIDREGPSHRPHFTMAVRLASGSEARGEGASKRAAERAAAAAMLKRLEGGE